MTDYRRAPKSNRFVVPEPVVTLPAPREESASTPLATAIHEHVHNPLAFVLETFAWGKAGTFLHKREQPLAWQLEVLADIGTSLAEDDSIYRLAISSGKGAGKTALAAWLFLWHVATHPDSQTVCTSVTAQQAMSRLWREIRKWRSVWSLRDLFTIQNQRLLHATSDTWFGVNQAWSEDRPEAFQGVHEGHVAFIVDEASGVPDAILETIETGLTDAHVFLAYTSNPTRARGRFRECFRQRAALWHGFTIDTREVEIVRPERIQEQLAECGGDIDASSFRANVRGLFPLEDYDQVCPDWLLQQACERDQTRHEWEDVAIGADIARFGLNKTVFTARQGSVIVAREVHRKLEVTETARRLMLFADQWRHRTGRAATICIDSDGIGAGVFDLLHEALNSHGERYDVVAVHSGIEATYPHRFVNRRAELWYCLREWLRTEGCLDATDTVLLTQLSEMRYRQDPAGRMQIETKAELAARGVPSPDEADSLVYTLAGESVATLLRVLTDIPALTLSPRTPPSQWTMPSPLLVS